MKKDSLFLALFLFFLWVSQAQALIMEAISPQLEQLNKNTEELLAKEGEGQKKFDILIKKQDDEIRKLIEIIKSQTEDEVDSETYTKTIKFLNSRITANKSRGNNFAVARDQTEIKTLQVKLSMLRFFSFIIKSRNTYVPKRNIVEQAQKELEKLEAAHVPQIPERGTGEVYNALKMNNYEFRIAAETYSDILSYVVDHPEQIATISWLYYLRIGTIITLINNLDEPIITFNRWLSPLSMSVGRLVVALFFLCVVFLLPAFFRRFERTILFFTRKFRLSFQGAEIFFQEIKKPVRALIVFFGINLSTLVFFYKTDLEQYIVVFNYIVYSSIFVYLFFKIVDALAIIRFDQAKNQEIPLRGEFINLLIRAAKFLIVVIVVSTGLGRYGIKMTAILSTLGIGGLAFALAAKDTLSNLFGGITILLDDVFRQGDWITLNEVEGTVVELGIRSTTVRSFDNALISIPNSVIANQHIINWNRREVGRRIKLYIGVTYESKISDLQKAVKDIRFMLEAHPDISQPGLLDSHRSRRRRSSKFVSEDSLEGKMYTQMVFFDRYGPYSMDIMVYCFARTTNWAKWLAVKEDVLYRIHKIIADNNLEFAYPTQSLLVSQTRGESGEG